MILKSVFLRVISTLIASVMLLFAGIGGGESYNVKDPENLMLNFSVLSDCHIEGNNFARFKVFSRALQNINKNENGNDAVIFLGDNTMNGQNIENMIFHGGIASIMKNQKIISVMGNHDIGNGNGNYNILQNRWYSYTEAFFGRSLDRPYYYEVIDGCYFIVMGMDAQTVNYTIISEEQYSWLGEVLALASESGKPAFVFSHYPAAYTYDENGSYTSRLVDMLREYNKTNDLFYFCGHTHIDFSSRSFHTENGFPETYLPRLTELEGDNDNIVSDVSGIGVEVELYENEVVIRARNFYTGSWLTEGENTCERTYQLKNPIAG
ncbi:MAG: metallophosphoesterase [Oscillospiraceae bacterium]|nr:metallophosphoesterase [Oscillospiraceae bacterium]